MPRSKHNLGTNNSRPHTKLQITCRGCPGFPLPHVAQAHTHTRVHTRSQVSALGGSQGRRTRTRAYTRARTVQYDTEPRQPRQPLHTGQPHTPAMAIQTWPLRHADAEVAEVVQRSNYDLCVNKSFVQINLQEACIGCIGFSLPYVARAHTRTRTHAPVQCNRTKNLCNLCNPCTPRSHAEVAEVAEVFRPHATGHYHPHAVAGPSERSNACDRGGKGERRRLFRSTTHTPPTNGR